MENLLLKDSNYKKRSNLQSVRSYLENESKSILPCSKAIPKSVLDSPPNNLRKTKTGFGAKFRDLLHGSCTQEVDLVLAKRKVRNISSEFEEKARYTPDTAIVEKRIRPSPSVKQPDLLEEKSLFAPKNLISQDKECVSFSKNAGFSNLQWRERMRTNTSLTSSYTSQSFLSTKSESTQYVVPEESPIQSDPSPSPAISSSPPTENTTKLSRNIKSLNTEVSSNFIKKDLRRRGSYKHKGGIKSRKRDSRRQNPSCAEIGCSDDAELERGRSYGLSGFGLDPFHLYLEKKQLKNHNPIKNEVSVPLCTGHQMPAKLMTVKKSTMNKGKKFYCCSYPFDQRCKFFLWEDDNPNILLQAPDPTVTVGEQQSYAQSLLSRYRMRLGDLDHFELKNEVNRLNHFLAELNLGIQISSSGTKASLIESLLKGIREIFFDTNDDQSVHISRISCDSKEPFSAPLISDESGDSVISLSDDEFEFEKSREHPAEDIILSVLRRTFRHSQLKDGQNWVINRVLSHQKSLLVLPTGAGKSLAFLLPSLLICPRDGITIVISPLIALMRDQMRKLPFNLPAACLSGEVTAAEAAAICTDLKNGYLRILFISPERLCSPSFRRLINLLHRVDRPRTSQITDDLSTEFTGPGVGLLCIDEAHCLSQWSFNFRPSFLRIRREIERIQPKSILALTATAPVHVQQDIQNELGIVSDGIWIQSPARPNLQMMSEYVSNEDEKRKVIIEFLQQSAVVKSKKLPTIIYVWRRNEAESLSEFLQQQGLSSRPYHAGMPSAQRIKIQYLFNRGVIDVVVATIAFGMGIDKPNIRIVIHHSMPKDIESYLQEIGRAGRDGLPARCLLLLSRDDFFKHHSLAYSSTLSTIQLELFLRRIFSGFGHNAQISLDIDAIASELDISVSLIETIICFLEEEPYFCLRFHESRFDKITGKLKDFIDSDPLVKSILKLNQSPSSQSMFEVSLLALSNNLGITPDETSTLLYQAQSQGALIYQLSRRSLYLTITPPLECPDIDSWIREMARSVTRTLHSKLDAAGQRVQDVWNFGKLISGAADAESNTNAEQYLQNYMSDHNQRVNHDSQEVSPLIHLPELRFNNSYESQEVLKCKRQIDILFSDPAVNDLVERILASGEGNRDLKAVVISKILHGVQTTHIKSVDWEHRAQWNSCLAVSFPTLLSLCRSRDQHGDNSSSA